MSKATRYGNREARKPEVAKASAVAAAIRLAAKRELVAKSAPKRKG